MTSSIQTGRPVLVSQENSDLAVVVPINEIQAIISIAVNRYKEIQSAALRDSYEE